MKVLMTQAPSSNSKMKKEVTSKPGLSRRNFIGTTAAAVAGFTIVPRHVLGGPKYVPPSEKINIAIVGCGGQGLTNIRNGLFPESDVQITAIADPCEFHDLSGFYYGGTAGRFPVKKEVEDFYSAKRPNYKVADYEDFRVMLEKEKSIDAVLCATPDHNHAIVSVTAMRQGKHVYCEKPLTHNIWEARLVSKVARETGVATQLGNQGHSGDAIRTTCEWIWAGTIGDIREVHAWTNASRWNKQHQGGMPAAEPVPKGVNWDLWLGTRSQRPYSHIYNPVSWRDFWDFGTAPIGDFFCHNFDPACWALDLKEPISIEAHSPQGVDSYIAPPQGTYVYQFGPRGKMPAVKFTWYEGGLMPDRPASFEADDVLPGSGNGILFIGEKGMIACPGWAGAPKLLPGSKNDNFKAPPKTLKRVPGHHRDWLNACKGGEKSSANFEYSAQLTEIGLLGLLAMRTGKKINWDAKAMKAKGMPEADQMIKESYRPGWKPA